MEDELMPSQTKKGNQKKKKNQKKTHKKKGFDVMFNIIRLQKLKTRLWANNGYQIHSSLENPR